MLSTMSSTENVPKGDEINHDDEIIDVIHDDEEKSTSIQKRSNYGQAIINGNVMMTDTGQLSHFGDEDHSNLDIQIIATEEIKGKLLKHTSFVIKSSLASHHTVSRRFNDFRWLHKMLSWKYLCTFIPPIPSSNILHKFNKEITSQRRYDLERFLNRIHSDSLLSKSESFTVFMTQQSQSRFKDQQKSISEKLSNREDKEIAEFIQQSYPDLNFKDIAEYDDSIYMEQIPRIREVYMRCDEQYACLNKRAQNIFKTMTSIVFEINCLNEELFGLRDIEKNDKPKSMINEWQQREDIGAFMEKWKLFEQNKLYCFYKYWCLNLKYEHLDCLAVLDVFIRYDIVYNKCKKLMKAQQKVNNNDDGKEDEELNEKVENIKHLLNTVCCIILKKQISKLWMDKIDGFNKEMERFGNKVRLMRTLWKP